MRKNNNNKLKVALKICLVLLIAVAAILAFLRSPYHFVDQFSYALLGIVPSIILYTLAGSNARFGYKEEEIDKYDKRIRESLPEDSKEKDILELMLANMRELKEYYELSKSHARNAFALAVTMCIMGFTMISMAVVIAYIGKQTNWAISVGGIITEVIAGTSLIVYKNSIVQLNRYYNALHENERFLSMVNLVSKISENNQDDVYIKIIESQIQILNKNEINNHTIKNS